MRCTIKVVYSQLPPPHTHTHTSDSCVCMCGEFTRQTSLNMSTLLISIAVATMLLVSTGYHHVHRLLLKYTVKLDV